MKSNEGMARRAAPTVAQGIGLGPLIRQCGVSHAWDVRVVGSQYVLYQVPNPLPTP